MNILNHKKNASIINMELTGYFTDERMYKVKGTSFHENKHIIKSPTFGYTFSTPKLSNNYLTNLSFSKLKGIIND